MDDVHRIELPTPFGVGTVNCYVLRGESVTVIDPGPAGEDTAEALAAGLDRLGYAPADVDRVLITHEHMDHFGGARRLGTDSGARVLAHRDAVEVVSDPTGHFEREQAFFAPFLVANGVPEETATVVTDLPEPYTEFQQPVTVDRELEDGDVMHLGPDTRLDVVHTPGHAPGQVCLVAAAEGVAFTGDHVLTHITPNPLLTLAPGEDEVRTRSLPDYMDSLETVLSIDADVGYGGHREVIQDLHGRVRETIAHHQDRKDRIAGMLEDRGPATAYDLMRELFPNLPTTETFAGMSEVIGHLDLLEDEGRAERVEADHTVRYRLG